MAKTVSANGFDLDDGGQRVVVDPICRIEGHLRIEVNLDEANTIRNAVSTGNMWRGLEIILKGRDPRDAWAFTERICGVCTGVHALVSCRAVEDAPSSSPPDSCSWRQPPRSWPPTPQRRPLLLPGSPIESPLRGSTAAARRRRSTGAA